LKNCDFDTYIFHLFFCFVVGLVCLVSVSHLRVYKREEIPDHFHYRNNLRIAPVVALAEEGWSITTRTTFATNYWRYNGGAHGYDPSYDSMHGIFVANGIDYFENTIHRI
jgi:ectonucleotide pyrophosphatase/phosphodiesterase family protein 5